MEDDFFDDLELDDVEDELQETPDWMAFGGDLDEEEDEPDEFDRLRQKSARAGSAFDDIAEEDPFQEEQGSSFLQNLTPSQRTILAVLVLLNVIVIGVALVLLVL